MTTSARCVLLTLVISFVCAGCAQRTTGGAVPALRSHTIVSQDRARSSAFVGPDEIIAANGEFYGTAFTGGSYQGGGIFGITASGKASRLYSFDTLVFPWGPVANVNGTLYGSSGNSYSDFPAGGVYGFDPALRQIVYSYAFQGAPDGEDPVGGIVASGGTLYGFTDEGGTSNQCGGGLGGCGTIYTIDPSGGRETVLYSFGDFASGRPPEGSPVLVGNTLYGTTDRGGSSTCSVYGCGVVFAFNLDSAQERVLYTFQDETTTGASPGGRLLAADGVLYGVAAGGQYGHGIVFAVTIKTGAERIVHNFSGSPDGSNPSVSFIHNGVLYGVTSSGGSKTCAYHAGCGTIFSIDLAGGTYKVLYTFKDVDDGRDPVALTLRDGNLYGTTYFGGRWHNGTFFELSLSGRKRILHTF